MPLRNSSSGYGSVARMFHWLTALLVLTVIGLGLSLAGQPTSTDAEVARTAAFYSLHKTIGLAIFLVTLARLLWAAGQVKPRPLHPERRLETFAADLVHGALYGALLVMPLSGWIGHAASTGFAPILWPFGQSMPFVPKAPALAGAFSTLHAIASKVLIATLILHVAGALRHALIDRDATLARMIRGSGPLPPERPRSHGPELAALAIWILVVAGGLVAGANRPAAPVTGPAGAALPSAAGNWAVEGGTLAFVVRQMGADVQGTLGGWTADIAYDETGRTGRVRVTIPLSAMSLGAVTGQAAGPEFFDSANHPEAAFAALISDRAGQLVATGTLSLRGREVPVELPFDLTIAGDRATMEGAVTLDRRDFGMGPSYPDETTVGFMVRVNVSLTARRE